MNNKLDSDFKEFKRDTHSRSVPENSDEADSEIRRLRSEVDEQLRKLAASDYDDAASVARSEQEDRWVPPVKPSLQAGQLPRINAKQVGQPPAPTSHDKPFLAIGLLVGAVGMAAVLMSNQSTTQAPLKWQASCGSPPMSGSRWWPVLGPAEAMEIIRSRYCGDAYVTVYGFTQVASFSSNEEALDFAQRLSDASGYSYRVGEPLTP